MKKLFSAVILCAIAAGAYFFLSSGDYAQKTGKAVARGNLKTGIYKVAYDQADFRGWKAFFSMQVDETGEVKTVKYDYEGKNGVNKTQDAGYNRAMKNKNGLGPESYCPRFEKSLIIYQDPAKVDAITGATHSYHTFKDFSTAAFAAAARGDTTPISVKQPETVDPAAKEKK